MKKKPKNYITFILDRSGSMQCLKDEAVQAFNQQVETIKKTSKGMTTRVSLVTFSTTPDEPKYWNEPLKSLKKLTLNDYKPEGMTAMLDAVAITVNKLLQLEDANNENVSFLVIVVSDGQENNSKEFGWNNVAKIIQEAKATNRWTFTYLGANQDLGIIQQRLSIDKGNISLFAANKGGYVKGSQAMSAGILGFSQCRAAGGQSVNNFYSTTTTAKKKK